MSPALAAARDLLRQSLLAVRDGLVRRTPPPVPGAEPLPSDAPGGAAPRAIVRARGLRKSFGEGDLATHVLLGVSLELFAGELVLLVGPSGSGKTTLISILAGLLRPTEGEVELCGEPLAARSDDEIALLRRAHVGFVFQSYNLFPCLTATDNVAEILALRGVKIREARARAREALGRVGLAHRVDRLPEDLSGGEKQRVAIARALAAGPALVLADEPTAALDHVSAGTVMRLLRDLVGARSAVVVVTHDRRLFSLADRVVELEDGRVKRDGPIRGGPDDPGADAIGGAP
jgi:putative ABC transport system ATP-binding protein